MTTRDVSATTFVGNAGSATLSFKVSMVGSAGVSTYDESFDAWLNTYSPRLETAFDFSSSANAQTIQPNTSTRFIVIVPPTGCAATLKIGTSETVTDCVAVRANCPLIFGCAGTTLLYLKPSATASGLFRMLQY